MDQFFNRIKKGVLPVPNTPPSLPRRSGTSAGVPRNFRKGIKAKTRRGGGDQRTVNNNTPAFGETLFRQLEDQTAQLFSDQSLLLF